MANKKLKKPKKTKNIPAEPTSNICKVPNCDKKVRTDGFCFFCYSRHSRGLVNNDGKKTNKAIAEEKKVAKLKEKAAKRIKERQMEADKDFISKNLTKDRLKILQTKYPENTKPWYCEKLSFFTSNDICFYRIYTAERKNPDCLKCKIHDDKLGILKEFISSVAENKGTI